MSIMRIEIVATEKDNVQNLAVHFTETDDTGASIPARTDKMISIMERAKMQVLGASFAKAASEKFAADTELHKMSLGIAVNALNAATELNTRLTEAGAFALLGKVKKQRARK